jgi:hypothetical protein
VEVYDPDMFERPERPGALPLASMWVLAMASLAMIAIAWVGAYNFAWFLSLDSWWLSYGFGLAVSIAVAIAWVPRWSMARALRVAIVLPAVVVAAGAASWVTWLLTPSTRYMHLADEAPLACAVPLGVVALVAGCVTLAIARVIVWKRRSEWLHAWVILCLVFLLLVGICVPIAAALHSGKAARRGFTYDELRAALDGWPIVLAIPAMFATAFTMLAMAEPLGRWRLPTGLLTPVLVLTAIICGAELKIGTSQVYANYAHFLLALALVAGVALATLGVASWRTRHVLAGSTIRGTIARDGDETVAAFEIAGWLRGPRLTSRAFEVNTPEGPVRVTRDIRVVAALPALSTRLRTGEAVRVLRVGDRVVLAGFEAPHGDHPFRASHGWIPTADAAVARRGEPSAGFAGVALALWRPCVAYLLVVTAVALPALAAALAVAK